MLFFFAAATHSYFDTLFSATLRYHVLIFRRSDYAARLLATPIEGIRQRRGAAAAVITRHYALR